MHMVGVKARGVQSHRPTAVETPAAVISTAQRIGAVTDTLEIAIDRRRKTLEERLNHRVGTAGQILGGFRAMAQRLKQQRVAVRVVQAVEADPEVGKKTD